MIRAYEQIVDLFASGGGPSVIAGYNASPEIRQRLTFLIDREKTGVLTAVERSELDAFIQAEHLMRLVKARARAQAAND